jgi:hypothetical protein
VPVYTPDWYPDPTRRYEYRYHNGAGWTGDVSVHGQRYVDPLPSAASPQQWAPAPQWRPHPDDGMAHFQAPSPGQFQPEKMAKPMAALILGIGSVIVGWVPFLCVLAAIGAVLAFIFGLSILRGDSERRREGREQHRGHGFALAGVILAPIGLVVSALGIWLTVVTVREVQEYTNPGRRHIEISDCTFGDGDVRATGFIENQSDKTRTYHITIDFYRTRGGSRIGAAGTYVRDLAPGDRANWSVSDIAGTKSVFCAIASVYGPSPFSDD